MATNKNIPLGAIHIKFPFKSMDDVTMDGVYGPAADAVIQRLREHFTPAPPVQEDPQVQEADPEAPTEQEMTMQVLKRLQGR